MQELRQEFQQTVQKKLRKSYKQLSKRYRCISRENYKQLSKQCRRNTKESYKPIYLRAGSAATGGAAEARNAAGGASGHTAIPATCSAAISAAISAASSAASSARSPATGSAKDSPSRSSGADSYATDILGGSSPTNLGTRRRDSATSPRKYPVWKRFCMIQRKGAFTWRGQSLLGDWQRKCPNNVH